MTIDQRYVSLPDKVKQSIEELTMLLSDCLAEHLIGVYLNGSISLSAFNPKTSDIDVLCIVRILTDQQRKMISDAYNRIKLHSPNKIELFVIYETVLTNFSYPTPCELYLNGEEDKTTKFESYDIAAILEMTRLHGITLIGKDPIDIIKGNYSNYFLKSIIHDALWSVNNIEKGPTEGYCEIPAYAVSCFCRVLAYVKEKQILSKLDAIDWAYTNLPKDYNSLLESTRIKLSTDTSQQVSCKLLKDFAAYYLLVVRDA